MAGLLEFLHKERQGHRSAIDARRPARTFLFAQLVRGGVRAEKELWVAAESGFANSGTVFRPLGQGLAKMVRPEGVAYDVVQSHHQVVYRNGSGHFRSKFFDRLYGLCGTHMLEDDFQLREFFGQGFHPLDKGRFTVQAELAGFFAVDAQHQTQLFHQGHHRENPFEVADAVGTVGRDACGVILSGHHAYGHHVFQVLLRVVRVQLEGHEGFKVRAHILCRCKNFLLVFGDGLGAGHGGNGVWHDDGAAKLCGQIPHIAGHQVALPKVRVKIVGKRKKHFEILL